ncbi:response regulator transcription factor [Streptomyces spiralis]|uniref:response regulator transcription factor n=1 Tax=Streptomyces spiralis TaxID=66376 RepID=UPI0036CAC0DB
MITVLNLRRHIITAADELNLPLTVKQVDHLTNRVAAHAARGRAPRLALTTQQHAVLVGLASGEDSGETAHRLGLSVDTVKTHKRRLYKALGAVNGAHAVAVASNLGLLRTAQQAAAGRSGGDD